MGAGPESLLFAQYPLIWAGAPMAVWLGWIMWKIRRERHSVVWWLLLALTILAAALALENAFYPAVRVQRFIASGSGLLDGPSATYIAAALKALYVLAFTVAGSAILELIVHVNSERRVTERIVRSLFAIAVYGAAVAWALW